MIKYLGSKRTLLPHILEAVARFPSSRTVLDLFSGTSRVGHALKRAGYRVLANDHNAYAHALAACYIQADAEDHLAAATAVINELNAGVSHESHQPDLRAEAFASTYGESARFFHPRNARRIALLRERIEGMGLARELRAILLVSLMEAADRVDSTTGVQMAYLKSWAPRALNDLALRVPDLLPRSPHGKGDAHQLDALEAARRFDADIAYLDPPYNQHSYLGNYHLWETLVRWDHPEVYGVARKRIDCRTRRSPFNSRRQIRAAMADLIAAVRAPVLIVSFSDEGYLTRDEMEHLLATRGRVEVHAHDYPRYVGARIGIYNPRGQKVGRVSHLRNTEYLFVVTPRAVPARPRAKKHRPRGTAAGAPISRARSRPSTCPCPPAS